MGNNSAPVRVFTKRISNVHSSKDYLSRAGHSRVYPEIPCINTSTNTSHGDEGSPPEVPLHLGCVRFKNLCVSSENEQKYQKTSPFLGKAER